MAGRIQRAAVGLLDYLGLKSTGDTPGVFPDALAGVLEQSRFYEAARSENYVQQANILVTTSGTWGLGGAVPQNELWLVQDACIRVTWPASGSCANIGAVIQNPGSPSLFTWRQGPLLSAAAGAGEIVVLPMPGPFVMKAGDEFAFYAKTVSIIFGASAAFIANARLVRLQI